MLQFFFVFDSVVFVLSLCVPHLFFLRLGKAMLADYGISWVFSLIFSMFCERNMYFIMLFAMYFIMLFVKILKFSMVL